MLETEPWSSKRTISNFNPWTILLFSAVFNVYNSQSAESTALAGRFFEQECRWPNSVLFCPSGYDLNLLSHLFYVCGYFPNKQVYPIHFLFLWGGQERVSDVLELKCQSVVSSQVDAGSQTWILYKRRMFSWLLSHLSSPTVRAFVLCSVSWLRVALGGQVPRAMLCLDCITHCLFCSAQPSVSRSEPELCKGVFPSAHTSSISGNLALLLATYPYPSANNFLYPSPDQMLVLKSWLNVNKRV